MSVDIDWEKLTSGPDSRALADSVRDFVHDRFQQVTLPRFIRAVKVHSFDFGHESPVVELKDICDPLPDFYEDEEGESQSGEDLVLERDATEQNASEEWDWVQSQSHPKNPSSHSSPAFPMIDNRPSYIRPNFSLADQIASPMLSRSSTPGIPGGTSSLGYFHLPLNSGLSGASSSLQHGGGIGGMSQSKNQRQQEQAHGKDRPPLLHEEHVYTPSVHRKGSLVAKYQDHSHPDPSTRPSTANTYSDHQQQPSFDDSFSTDKPDDPSFEPAPDDVQIVWRVSYDGSIRLSLSAEVLLDYPMSSFVSIPLKLNVTGLSFDGVALLAYLRKRAHFCFLAADDAAALLGNDYAEDEEDHTAYLDQQDADPAGKTQQSGRQGGLLREIRVESEIGQQEGGKQVLKNVGKVERFVLEQVRRIFEEELVYPSFWTFLV
ncbi:Mitochondrial distribution and morphology protein 12 [Agyrium rufum]|nr:Mitochondrial distribution and morphology protein 12 [Agyrium rufum]